MENNIAAQALLRVVGVALNELLAIVPVEQQTNVRELIDRAQVVAGALQSPVAQQGAIVAEPPPPAPLPEKPAAEPAPSVAGDTEVSKPTSSTTGPSPLTQGAAFITRPTKKSRALNLEHPISDILEELLSGLEGDQLKVVLLPDDVEKKLKAAIRQNGDQLDWPLAIRFSHVFKNENLQSQALIIMRLFACVVDSVWKSKGAPSTEDGTIIGQNLASIMRGEGIGKNQELLKMQVFRTGHFLTLRRYGTESTTNLSAATVSLPVSVSPTSGSVSDASGSVVRIASLDTLLPGAKPLSAPPNSSKKKTVGPPLQKDLNTLCSNIKEVCKKNPAMGYRQETSLQEALKKAEGLIDADPSIVSHTAFDHLFNAMAATTHAGCKNLLLSALQSMHSKSLVNDTATLLLGGGGYRGYMTGILSNLVAEASDASLSASAQECLKNWGLTSEHGDQTTTATLPPSDGARKVLLSGARPG